MKKSRIIYVLLALIIIAGAICAYTMKFNFSLAYDDSVRIDISIGKEYKVEDMNQIAKEVFQDQEFIVQDVEIFNDMAAITVRTVTDEQKNQLVQKVNEKYGTELTTDDLLEVKLPHYRGRDIMRRYFWPIGISSILILIYMLIRYHKLGKIKVLVSTVLWPVVMELVYLSILAITRLPISFYTLPLVIVVATMTLFILAYCYEKKLASSKRKEDISKIKEEETEK